MSWHFLLEKIFPKELCCRLNGRGRSRVRNMQRAHPSASHPRLYIEKRRPKDESTASRPRLYIDELCAVEEGAVATPRPPSDFSQPRRSQHHSESQHSATLYKELVATPSMTPSASRLGQVRSESKRGDKGQPIALCCPPQSRDLTKRDPSQSEVAKASPLEARSSGAAGT